MISVIPTNQESDCVSGAWHDLYQDRVNGQIVCRKCGLILAEQQFDSEWSLPREILKREFISPAITTSFTSLNPKPSDQIPTTLTRALKWSRNTSWLEKKITLGLIDQKISCEKLNLSNSVREQAAVLYRRAVQLAEFHGAHYILLAYVTLYYICRTQQVPLNWEDLLIDTPYTKSGGIKYFSILINRLHLKRPAVNPTLLLSKIVAKMRLETIVEEKTRDIIQRYSQVVNTSGVDPRGIMGAGLFLACQQFHIIYSQGTIAKQLNITEGTIRNRVREITSWLNRAKFSSTLIKHEQSNFY
jgi:transcription initiation factor TFIIB